MILNKKSVQFLFLFLFLSHSLYSQKIWYVNQDACGITTGLTWQDAFSDLQTAIDSANSGDQIWIASGKYIPSSYYTLDPGIPENTRRKHFRLKHGVKIYGGFFGNETDISERCCFGPEEANETILSGDLNNDDNYQIIPWAGINENCYHVILLPSYYYIDSTSVLDGVTISGGHANGSFSDSWGGGIYTGSHNTYILSNVSLIHNAALIKGGGAFTSNAEILFRNIFVSNNRSNLNGGGLAFTSSQHNLENVLITNNYAVSFGGGIYFENPSVTKQFNNVTLTSNNSGGKGGAIYNTTNNITMTNVNISQNSAPEGGGIYCCGSITIINGLIVQNSANNGGGIFSENNLNFINVTLANNSASFLGGGVYQYSTNALKINNSILWGNLAGITGNQIYSNSNSNNLNFSCFPLSPNDCYFTNLPSTVFSINEDPLFCSSSTSQYSLFFGSPCCDKGADSLNTQIFDLRGPSYYRKLNSQNGTPGIIDMGAFEFNFSTDSFPPTIIYVKHNATGLNNGTSWQNAYTEIQPAINSASEGNHVWIAAGVYFPTDFHDCFPSEQNKHIRLKKGVQIYGGFDGTEPSAYDISQRNFLLNTTIISGDLGVSGSYSDNLYHVIFQPDSINLDSTTILDGVSIGFGYANGIEENSFGAGIYIGSNTLVLKNITLYQNYSFGNGAAVYIGPSSDVKIFQLNAYSNFSASDGGAIFVDSANVLIMNSTITNNSAIMGGGVFFSSSNVIVLNSILWKNNAAHGSQVYVDEGNTKLHYSCFSDSLNNISGFTFIDTLSCIHVDPLFLNEFSNLYMILGISPCVDRGVDSLSIPKHDIRGRNYIRNSDAKKPLPGRIDIGAYEFNPQKDIYSKSDTLYVNHAANGANNGTSWNDAFTSFQDALFVALPNNEIWIAKGVYFPTYSSFPSTDPRMIHFRIPPTIKIYGGFYGTETHVHQRDSFLYNQANEVTLCGDLGSNDVFNNEYNWSNTEENAYHVVVLSSGNPLDTITTIDGITISRGCANISDVDFLNRGAGIYSYNSGITLKNVTITRNSSFFAGGIFLHNSHLNGTNILLRNNLSQENSAVLIENNSTLSIDTLVVDSNKCTGNNAGINGINSNVYLKNFQFNLNTSDNNFSSPILSLQNGILFLSNGEFSYNNKCITTSYSDVYGEHLFFLSNTGTDGTCISSYNDDIVLDSISCTYNYSGGNSIFLFNHSEIIFRNSILNSNQNLSRGIIYCTNLQTPLFYNIKLFSNNTLEFGGGFYFEFCNQVLLQNILLAKNTATFGGGFYSVQSSIEGVNLTITDNTVPQKGGGIYTETSVITLKNSINTKNTSLQNIGNDFMSDNSQISLLSSCFSDSANSDFFIINNSTVDQDSNCFNTDPLFVDALNFDYRLFGISLCVDKGVNSYNNGLFDLRGQPRILNSIIDFGAYEYNTLTDPYSNSQEVLTIPNIKIFPNPTSGIFFFQTTTPSVVNLYNIHGKIVYSTNLNTSSYVDISFLPNGVYFVYLNNQAFSILLKQ